MDHVSEASRIKAIEQIQSFIHHIRNTKYINHVLLLGDFSATKNSNVYNKILSQLYMTDMCPENNNVGTLHGFQSNTSNNAKKIDHIFFSHNIDSMNYEVIRKKFYRDTNKNQEEVYYASDHHPVYCELDFQSLLEDNDLDYRMSEGSVNSDDMSRSLENNTSGRNSLRPILDHPILETKNELWELNKTTRSEKSF